MARYRTKAWISLRKKPRQLETPSVVRTDAAGQPIALVGPPRAVEALVRRLPPTASQAVTVGDTTSWTWTLAARLGGRGTVRLVVRCAKADLTGTSAVLVPHRGDWPAQRILPLSVPRWPLETLSQDGTTSLGVDA